MTLSSPRNKTLGIISAIDFNERYLLALDKRWGDFFSIQNPIFEARIDDNEHLVLVGPQLKLQPTKQNPRLKEDSIDE